MGKPIEATFRAHMCPRCQTGFMMMQSIAEPSAFSCGHLDLTVGGSSIVGQHLRTCCPNCLLVRERLIYDAGSGPEASCASCEWCWLVTGDKDSPMLYPEITVEMIEAIPSWARPSQYRRCATCFAPEGHCLTKPAHVYVPIKDTLAAP